MSTPAEHPRSSGPRALAPTRKARRIQAAIDSGVALVLTVLVWPFPLARATLSPIVIVISILVLWQVLQVAYFALAMAVWGATGGTRVTGLRLVTADGEAPNRRQRVLWGVLSGAIAVIRVLAPAGEERPDLPERVAGVEVVVTPIGA